MISKLVDGQPLAREEMQAAMEIIFGGQATPAQIGSFLTALRVKGETVEEITGAALALRARAIRIEPRARILVDTCGTGGDARGTFNISTCAAFVVAGAGVAVAKHGNRGVSSRCGSADVLAALGVNVDAPPDLVTACIDDLGIGFLFAPKLHGAMRHAAGPRREIGIRTLFNLLGPLSNPAGARYQLLGIYDGRLLPLVGEVLRLLGTAHALVVHGQDGLDEISPCAPTDAVEVSPEGAVPRRITPADFGLAPCDPRDLQGGDPEQSAAILRGILEGRTGGARTAVIINAGAALFVAGAAADLRAGAELATRSLDAGAALAKLDQLIAFTRDGA